MANIFSGISTEAQCVREWDRLLRNCDWVDTEIFRSVFDFEHISGEQVQTYEKAIKKAKKKISLALQERGMSLREKPHPNDNRRVLTAYPEYNLDPLHNMRIMADIEKSMRYSRALQITYSPSYHQEEEHIFHPQYLRVYNGRDYVYGVYDNEEENKGLPFVTLAIDRIARTKYLRSVYLRSGDQQDYEGQMRNILGASPNFSHPEVHEVILRTHNPKVHKLLLNKPLHHSIREQQPCTEEQTGILTMHVQLSQEVQNWILHYGTGIEVVAPKELRDEIAKGLSILGTYYSPR